MLVVRGENQTVSGPCPACGAWITGPSVDDASPIRTADPEKAVKSPAPRIKSSVSGRSKGRISVDSMVDYAHLENRESTKTLKVIAWFVLVICSCMVATWFLSDWMGK
jgi:hypothetical protein